jgi:hypothetical protein
VNAPGTATLLPPSEAATSRGSLAWLGLVFGLAAVVRLSLVWDDFTLDEIVSLLFATEAKSSLDLFRVTHDNNHLLNTLYLHWLGWRSSWVWYRLLALGAGCAGAVLLCVAARAARREERWVFGLLAALCFPLAYYSSEARGYAPAVAFSLLSFVLVRRFHDRPSWGTAALGWGSALLGLLAHMTFAMVALALALWSAVVLWRRAPRPALVAGRWLQCHLLPLALIGLAYFGFVRHLTIGGGPRERLADMALQLLASLTGAGVDPGWLIAIAAGLPLAALAVAGLWILRRAGRDEWIFLALVLLVPAAVMAVRRPTHIYARYFLVCAPFVLLLAGHSLTFLARRGGAARTVAAMLVGLFVLGSAHQIYRLATVGRASFHEAVMLMGRVTQGPVIAVSSDQDFRNELVLRFYARYLPAGKKLDYQSIHRWTAAGPEWLVAHGFRPEDIPDVSRLRYRGLAFRLERRYPHYGWSGWDWALFRREQPAP